MFYISPSVYILSVPPLPAINISLYYSIFYYRQRMCVSDYSLREELTNTVHISDDQEICR